MMRLIVKLLMASPTQGSIRSMAALPKRGAIPQQIMVAKAKIKGEVFTASLLFPGNEFRPCSSLREKPRRKEKGLPYRTWSSPSFRVRRTNERFAEKARNKTMSLVPAARWILRGRRIETTLSRFFGFQKVFIRLDDQVTFGFGIGRITG